MSTKQDTFLPRPDGFKQQRLAQVHTQHERRVEAHRLQQLFWECTLRCNLNCRHCGSDCRATSASIDMPFDDFSKVLDDVCTVMDAGRILVVTTGGEPLMRPDICLCGRQIRARGFHWGMVSNGMLLDERMCDKLLDAGLETIAVSLDGFENEHNWLRGHRDSFVKAERAIASLVGKPVVWDVITCVNRKNIDRLDEFKRHLVDIGVRHWRIFTVAPMGRAVANHELQLSCRQFKDLMDYICSVRREGVVRLSYGCEGFLGEYEWEVRDYPFFCQAGVNVASVLADGSISGCLSIRSQYHQGNIYKDKFTDVWQTRFGGYRQREWMHNGQCKSCDMWHYCMGGSMHLRDDDGRLLLCRYKSGQAGCP